MFCLKQNYQKEGTGKIWTGEEKEGVAGRDMLVLVLTQIKWNDNTQSSWHLQKN